jgi:hypothetical protein
MLLSVSGGEQRTTMNRANWTVQDAIAERVRQEDLVEWASKPNPVESKETMAKELPSNKWEETGAYVFGVSLRKLKGLLP